MVLSRDIANCDIASPTDPDAAARLWDVSADYAGVNAFASA
jgi:hypothetical protein